MRRTYRTLLLSLLPALAVMVALVGCEPTCPYERDGQCDVDIGICPVGTDTADCTTSTCPYENDGQCDVDIGICPVGTDTADCGTGSGTGGGDGSGTGSGDGNGTGGGDGNGPPGGGDGNGPPGGAGACPGVTYPDDFEAWSDHPDPKPSPPGWEGPPTTIQVTSHCAIACVNAFEFGPNTYEVQSLCQILFANYSQTHQGQSLPVGYCKVCDPHRPTAAGTIDSLFAPAD